MSNLFGPERVPDLLPGGVPTQGPVLPGRDGPFTRVEADSSSVYPERPDPLVRTEPAAADRPVVESPIVRPAVGPEEGEAPQRLGAVATSAASQEDGEQPLVPDRVATESQKAPAAGVEAPLPEPAIAPPQHVHTRPKLPPRVEQAIGPLRADTTLEERHPGWPKVKLQLYLGNHGSAEDFRDLPGAIKGEESNGVRPADVYLPEVPNDKIGLDREIYNQLTEADGRLSDAEIEALIDENHMRGEIMEAEVRALAPRRVIVGSMDVSRNDYSRFGRALSDLNYFTPQATLDETLAHIDAGIARVQDELTKRDTAILGPTRDPKTGLVTAGNFEREMERIFQEHPELLQQEEVRVVATCGVGHAMLRHRAAAAGVTLDKSLRSVQYGTHVNTYEVQLMQTRTFGKEPSRDLRVKAFNGLVIRQQMIQDGLARKEDGPPPHPVRWIYERSLVDAMDEQDAQRLHSSLSQGQDMRATIDSILTEKGMDPLATTTTDVWRGYQRVAAPFPKRLQTKDAR